MSAHLSQNPALLPWPSREEGKNRLHGLDWLRALASVLVVMLHAGIPYAEHPMPGLAWSADSAEKSPAVDLIVWWIDGFVMPLFFLMTGFFAARLFTQYGPDGFLRHRAVRLGGPFVFGMVAILPLDLYAWLLGWVDAGLVPARKLRSLKVTGPLGDALWGVSHLWYLEYVLTYCLVAWLIHELLRVSRRSRQQVGERFWDALPTAFGVRGVLIGALIAGSALWYQPRIVIGFRHAWLPMWENLVYYAVPFGWGWAWARQSDRSPSSPGTWLVRIGAATLMFAILWPRLQTHLSHESIPVADPWVPFLFAGFSLLMSTGAFGLALSMQIGRESRMISYVAAASFWIYLFHHPLVGLTHVDLSFVAWAPLLEFLLTTTVVLVMCLLTYEVGVRRTLLGVLINGTRRPTSKESPAGPVSVPERRRAA